MKNIINFACVMLICVSCTNVDKTVTKSVKVDFSKMSYISQSDGQIVNLETTDQSLLYDICSFNVYKDTFVVQSRNFLHTFTSTGKFIGCISRRGQAGNEYINLSNVFFEDNGIVGVYDFNKGTIQRFNLEGQLLSVQKSTIVNEDIKPTDVYPWNDGYIAKNCYGGEFADRKTLCFLDRDLTTATPIEGRSLLTGFSSSDLISVDKDRNVLYWEMLCDTLFTVNNDLLTPLLIIDFGEHALPADIARKDVYDRIDYANKTKEMGELFAGMARYYQRINDMIYFSCISPDNGIVLCQYNENKETIRLYAIDFDDKYKTGSFFLIKDDLVYWEIRDNNDLQLNPALFIFNLKDLV